MDGKTIVEFEEITTVDSGDKLLGVDVSDTSASDGGTNKHFTKGNLLKEVNSRAGDIESDVSELQGIISGLLDWFYPIGTIYETTSTDLDTTTKMATHFGGTWEAYGSGRVLVGKSADAEFDTIGETGGAKTHTLALTEIPSHKHSVWGFTGDPVINPNNEGGGIVLDSSNRWEMLPSSSQGIKEVGGGKAHNNLQPYIVVYRYRRTA